MHTALHTENILHKHRLRHGQLEKSEREWVYFATWKTVTVIIIIAKGSAAHTPRLPFEHMHTFVQVVCTIYSFIHTFVRSFIESLISYCRKCFSSCIFIVSIPYMHCSGGVHSNDTPFDAAPADLLLLLLSSSLVCICGILLLFSVSFPRSSFVWNSVPPSFKWCFLCATRNSNWCTYRVDCLTKWCGVENVAAYVFIMNRERGRVFDSRS